MPQAGESAEECRKRIWTESKQQWSVESPEGAVLRKTWGERAKQLNRATRSSSSQMVLSMFSTKGVRHDASLVSSQILDDAEPTRIQQLVQTQNTVDDSSNPGIGPCGLGDAAYAIKESLVSNADSTTPSFVKTFGNAWRSRAGGTVAATSRLPSRTVRLSCHQKFGFCVREIQNMVLYNHIITQLRQFVANHRRLHLTKGRNTGPSLNHQLPLLVMKPDVAASPTTSMPLG